MTFYLGICNSSTFSEAESVIDQRRNLDSEFENYRCVAHANVLAAASVLVHLTDTYCAARKKMQIVISFILAGQLTLKYVLSLNIEFFLTQNYRVIRSMEYHVF